ncbi:hypothetical protein ACFLZV_07185, partial [Candidatus Margulisiibacteriota bacterium]
MSFKIPKNEPQKPIQKRDFPTKKEDPRLNRIRKFYQEFLTKGELVIQIGQKPLNLTQEYVCILMLHQCKNSIFVNDQRPEILNKLKNYFPDKKYSQKELFLVKNIIEKVTTQEIIDTFKLEEDFKIEKKSETITYPEPLVDITRPELKRLQVKITEKKDDLMDNLFSTYYGTRVVTINIKQAILLALISNYQLIKDKQLSI